MTVHLVEHGRDVTFDLEGGNRIPKAAQRQARSVAELRTAGIGVRKVLMAHDGTPSSRDVFEWLLTMLAPEVSLDLVAIAPLDQHAPLTEDMLAKDAQHAEQLGREIRRLPDDNPSGLEMVPLRTKAHTTSLCSLGPKNRAILPARRPASGCAPCCKTLPAAYSSPRIRSSRAK